MGLVMPRRSFRYPREVCVAILSLTFAFMMIDYSQLVVIWSPFSLWRFYFIRLISCGAKYYRDKGFSGYANDHSRHL